MRLKPIMPKLDDIESKVIQIKAKQDRLQHAEDILRKAIERRYNPEGNYFDIGERFCRGDFYIELTEEEFAYLYKLDQEVNSDVE